MTNAAKNVVHMRSKARITHSYITKIYFMFDEQIHNHITKNGEETRIDLVYSDEQDGFILSYPHKTVSHKSRKVERRGKDAFAICASETFAKTLPLFGPEEVTVHFLSDNRVLFEMPKMTVAPIKRPRTVTATTNAAEARATILERINVLFSEIQDLMKRL